MKRSLFGVMVRREWLGYAAAALVVGSFLAGCGGIRRLADRDPEVGVYLPAPNRAEALERAAADSARAPKIITFRRR